MSDQQPTSQPDGLPAAPPPMPGAPVGVPKRSNGFAVASLVLGILTLVMFFAVWIPILMGILAVVFGGIGISRANKGAGQKGLAIAGLVCGAVGMLAAILFIVVIVNVVNDPEFQEVVTSILQSPTG